MKTLSKEITIKFFESEDGYQKLIARWSELMNDKEARKNLRAEHHLLYAILRGKNWHKGFTCATNPKKLANGMCPYLGLKQVLWKFQNKYGNDAKLLVPFKGIISQSGLDKARAYITATGYEDNPTNKEPYESDLDKLKKLGESLIKDISSLNSELDWQNKKIKEITFKIAEKTERLNGIRSEVSI